MTFFKFYIWLLVFVESFPVVTFFFGLRKWKKLSPGIKLFLGYIAADLLLNLLSYYFYYIKHSTLSLFYFRAFFQCTFLLLAFREFSIEKIEKNIMFSLSVAGSLLLLAEFFLVSEAGYSYIPCFWINLTIFITSVYYFSKKIININKGKDTFDEIHLTITLIISLQFFIKTVEAFLIKYLLETQSNSFLWTQIDVIKCYLMLFCLVMYTYAFYNLGKNEI